MLHKKPILCVRDVQILLLITPGEIKVEIFLSGEKHLAQYVFKWLSKMTSFPNILIELTFSNTKSFPVHCAPKLKTATCSSDS